MRKFKLLSLLFLICFVFILSSCKNEEELFKYYETTVYPYEKKTNVHGDSYTPSIDTDKGFEGIKIIGIRDKSKSDIIIPEEINGKKVVAIGEEAFSNNLKLESVVIPETVKVIGSAAFYNDVHLEKITLPSSLISIAPDAFNLKYNFQLKGNEKENGIYIGNDSNPYLALAKMKYNNEKFKIDDNCKYILSDCIDCKLDYLVLNKNILCIGSMFDYYGDVDKIYYLGTEEEWNSFSDYILSVFYNYTIRGYFNNLPKYFYTKENENETKAGLYWYYDSNNNIVEKVNTQE